MRLHGGTPHMIFIIVSELMPSQNVEYLFNFNKLLNTQIFDWIERPELHFKVGKLDREMIIYVYTYL